RRFSGREDARTDEPTRKVDAGPCRSWSNSWEPLRSIADAICLQWESELSICFVGVVRSSRPVREGEDLDVRALSEPMASLAFCAPQTRSWRPRILATSPTSLESSQTSKFR